VEEEQVAPEIPKLTLHVADGELDVIEE